VAGGRAAVERPPQLRSARTANLPDSDEANGRLEALFVISITLGLRPGELRKLTCDHVGLDRGVVHVWRSASKSGDTKTPKSKRSLELPKRALAALTVHQARQANERRAAGGAWRHNDLVFCHENGDPYTSDQLNWRFAKMTRKAGIGRWHAHEGHRDRLPTRDRARDPRGSDRDGRRL
jgi:integrase